MRENMTKREGLALGKYRSPVLAATLPTNIKWVKEDDYAVGLGVPIGNDLDAGKWVLLNPPSDLATGQRPEPNDGRLNSFGRLLVGPTRRDSLTPLTPTEKKVKGHLDTHYLPQLLLSR